MAQYKVLQDIEAEDKLLGPLTLRQFIYSAVVVVLGFIIWKLVVVQPLLALPFVPPLVFFAMLAAPFGHDQPSEVWMLAKIKYIVFPKRRIWDQDGIQDLVTITAPKVDPRPVIKDFDQTEATSRLKALASVMDTHGWVIKHAANSGYQSSYGQPTNNDRLLDLQTAPQDDMVSVRPAEDVLDPDNNPLARTMDNMQAQNEQAHRQAMLQNMQVLAAQQQTSQTVAPPVPAPAPAPAPKIVQKTVTQTPAPAILKEVKSPPPAEELHVNETPEENGNPDEVVISLH